MKRLLAACALIVALACMTSSAKAQNKFDYCLLCHGSNANGNPGIRAPKLSGMEPWYLARQLENFAAGVRGVPAGDAGGHEMMPVGLRRVPWCKGPGQPGAAGARAGRSFRLVPGHAAD